ncbi:MAG TPA: aminotransferase class III-fold pyridoxal phosphate-dependent enzyme [Acidimicrobiales bacterium]|nr:aminotransferase class III-fold pyridoxal phosphate-dependent enzyme [Acidimicrobiales bacterium]
MGRVLKTIGFDHYYERGEGCYLYDGDGRKYLDFLSGFGVFALGRGHPGVTRAIHDALDADLPNLVQMDCALLPGILAEELVNRSHPGIERAFFTNSGAEAIESVIKFARAATERDRILYCDHGFHGLTTGTLSLNGEREFRDGFGPILPSTCVGFGDIDRPKKELRRGDVAGFVVEPIQGKGVNLASEAYWRAVETLCGRHKTLFVIDEVRRRQEMGLLKALGFVRSQVAFCVSWQATTVALIGVVVGVPAGIAMGQLVWKLSQAISASYRYRSWSFGPS